MADADDKTEAATARQLSRARDEGNVALSREVPPLVTLALVWVMLVMVAPPRTRQLVEWMASFIGDVHLFDVSDGGVAALGAAAHAAARVVLPVALTAIVVGCAATMVQTNFLFTLSKLMPDISRISPQRGLKRVFSVHSLLEAGKALIKVLVVGIACWRVIAADIPQLQQAMQWEPASIVDHLVQMVLHVLLTMLGTQVAVAAADVFWTRYRHARDLRMTRSEVKQEHKDQEGDPVIRNRLRQIRRMRARRRMREAMKRATVVVANPTHYAVALSYDRARNAAPVVVAKGVDSMAIRIRETAREYGVPVVINPPLARALHKVEIDSDIPAELYKAVAELIAYVWRLKRQRAPRSAA